MDKLEGRFYRIRQYGAGHGPGAGPRAPRSDAPVPGIWKLRRNTEPCGFRVERAEDLVVFADLVVVAVKPHQVAGVIETLREMLRGGS